MSILKVARMGHPVLRAKARGIERGHITQPETQRLIDDMIETMVEYHGVGLAAPQVHEALRLFVAAIDLSGADIDKNALPDPIALINPEVTPIGPETDDDWEGCLSIPDIRGIVPRARAIRLRAYDRRGDRIDVQLHDYNARVVQHETDHVDGILFFDRMRSLDSLSFLEEYARYWVKD